MFFSLFGLFGETVKIAFYENGEFQSGASKDAVKSGYAYEYYRKLATLAGWNYEYVYGDWDSAYNAFINGQADLIAGLAYNENRLEYMNYPDLPMGHERYMIYRKSGNLEITEDKSSLNGKKIGTLSGAMEGVLKEWIDENKIEASIEVFGDVNKRNAALVSGDIQAIIGESSGVVGDFEVIFALQGVSYYIVTAKERTDLLDQLNAAQAFLYESNPNYQDYLQNKYFKQTSYARTLSLEEKNWLENNSEIRVGYKNRFRPLSHTDKNGNVTGIIKDFIPELFEKVGLNRNLSVKYEGYDDYKTMLDDLSEGKLDVVFPVEADLSFGENEGIYQTDVIFEGSMNLIYKGDYSGNPLNTFAVVRNMLILEEYVRRNYPDSEIIFFNSILECLQAVSYGVCDATVLTGLSTSGLLSQTHDPSLHYVRCKAPFNISMGVSEKNVVLLRFLNHCISNLSDNTFLDFSYRYTESFYQRSFRGFVRDNFLVVLVILLIVITVITFIFIMYIQLSKKEKEAVIKIREQLNIVNSLSRDYMNVFLISISTKTARTLKLDGYVTPGMGEIGDKEFAYLPMCEAYVNERVYPEDQQSIREAMKLENVVEHVKTGNEYIGTYRVNNKGEICFYQYKYILTGKDQIIAGFQNIDSLVKEREKQKMELEAALLAADQASKAKSSFLFNMSHDIRTPMNAIMGFADLAKKHQDDKSRQSDYLNKIQNSSEILLSILNNVLEMARIEKGTVIVEELAWDTEQLEKSIYAIFSEQIKSKGIKIKENINIINRYIYCDPVKIREIYMNIISNAVKYTMAGGTITFTVEEIPLDNGMTSFKTSISDTGIGMTEDFLSRIFDEFARERNSEGNVIEGTGLGMAITKRLVDLLGGTIEVQSQLGVGTTFTFVIPHRIAKQEDLLIGKKVNLKNVDYAGRRILLAEDNDLNAEITIEMLKSSSFQVERAANGKECIQMLTEKPAYYYDMILMDVQMPVMNGYAASIEIRKMEDLEKADIPIVALTANAFEEDRRNAFDAGMNGHISKPIDMNQFLSVISDVIGYGKTSSDVIEAYENEVHDKIFLDPLTGAFNRRYLEEKCFGGQITAIAMMDIDFFKQVNDGFGHQAGDAALKSVATTVKKLIRNTDALVRYGGDEFLILFENIQKEFLEKRLEQIRSSVEALRYDEYDGMKTTLSIGSVMTSVYDENVFKLVDKNLYEAKKKRNSIVLS
ncbi:MAG: diguanylate cyclase [Treponema sp.]|nr:diguanylate cyclase [Treponema sp.]